CANRPFATPHLLVDLRILPSSSTEDILPSSSTEDDERSFEMRMLLAILAVTAAAVTFGTRPSEAQYAAQLYPYCTMSSSSGATNCYVRSREECGSSCISNPWYIGPQRSAPYLAGHRPLEPRYMRP